MRLLTITVLLALLAPQAIAADKDDEKAKEAARAFLNAVKAKDLDAVMKTVDVPFLLDDKPELITKTDELKTTFKKLLSEFEPGRVPDKLGAVHDLPAIRKLVGSKKGKEKVLAQIEKVLGKSGFAVMLTQNDNDRGAVLVRVSEGKYKVVGIVE